MVYMVKVVNIVGLHYSTMLAPQSQTRLWSLWVWECLTTSISKSFKAEKNSTAQYSVRTSDWSGGTLLMVRARAIYSAGLSIYYIHGIMSVKRTCEIWPSLLVRYSLDTRKRYVLYIFTEFKVSERLHRGPRFSHRLHHRFHDNYS